MDGWMVGESQNQEAFYLRIYVTTEIKGKKREIISSKKNYIRGCGHWLALSLEGLKSMHM